MREITIIEGFVLVLLAVILAVHWMIAYGQEITPRELVLNEVKGANMAEPHDSIKCLQERWEPGKPWHVCISEAEWMRQHAKDVAKK